MTRYWAGALAHAARLGVAPHDFWALSVAEWLALTRGAATPGLARDALNTLCARFPDGEGR